MEPVKKGRIDHGLREWRQQVAGLHHGLHRLVDVAHKHHGSTGVDGLAPTAEGAGSHVVLHDLHAVVVFEADARHFVKSHHIPQADQAHLACAHVVEQVGHRGLAT